MTILASLAKAYDRMADRGEVSPFGYSAEKVGYIILLNDDGASAGMPIDMREGEGKKRTAPLRNVPQPAKRTSGIAPNFLWDKTAYVLGITAGESKRTALEHAAFVERHRDVLAGSDDIGLTAIQKFASDWLPQQFEILGWPADMKDQNVVFALASEYHERMIHDRPAARELWARISIVGGGTEGACLVTGEHGALARLHPAIKGVWGAQSSGGSIVSFNKDSFTSYGHDQGDNSPVSEAAAFAYSTMLNSFLEKGSANRIQIGDASTVFWADASDVAASGDAEGLFMAMLQQVDESMQSAKVKTILDKIREGRPFTEVRPNLHPGVRFHVLGLAPNAARLSVRFWIEEDFGEIARRFVDHFEAMRLDPPPSNAHPPIWRCLIETATLRKSENIPPQLAGDWLRAILSGNRYPQTLLANLLMRIRSDKDVNALRVAILKSILIRNFKKEAPVALDKANTEKGYILGRLFAIYEQIQSAALGRNVNATIKDKFYGSAAAQPRKVFAMLDKGSANHLSKIGKSSPSWKISLERHLSELMDSMDPANDPFPAQLPHQQQALFALGYYHQRSEFFRAKDKSSPEVKILEPSS